MARQHHHDPRWIMRPAATDSPCKVHENTTSPAFLLKAVLKHPFHFLRLFLPYLLRSPRFTRQTNVISGLARFDTINDLRPNQHMCMCAVDRVRCFGYFVPRAAK